MRADWRARLVLVTAAFLLSLLVAPSADAAQTTLNTRLAMSDGVSLQATITGQAPLAPRPVIVEFSPYGPGSMTTSDGPAYNYLLVQIRGTGDSDGQFDALGNRTQQDVLETLGWACHQPWSNGRLGLNGFSASAKTVYNSLHLKLPCVHTAVLRSGTFELYRDLLWPGGVSNFLPGLGVLALIGAPAAQEGFNRAQHSPVSAFDTAIGLFDAGLNGGVEHQTLDAWWQERGFRGDANHLPILMLDSFFDVESRGAFQAYQRLRHDGAHLLVVGAHDGAPAGTDDGVGAIKAWFDRHLRVVSNDVDRQPRVQMLMSDGSREGYLAGRYVRYDATDWPVPGTRWETLWLSPARSGSGHSINDGSLEAHQPSPSTTQAYAAVPSQPSVSDQPNTAIVGASGLNQAANAFPLLTETTLGEPQALTYTTSPLPQDVAAAGPAALDLSLSSTATETAMWAVISDVSADGTSHPVATGRLLSAYPNVIAAQSLKDAYGEIVQPYGDYSAKNDASPGAERLYRIEFWPIGNRFKRGHRIRLVVLGASAASSPSAPALNTIRLGGGHGSRLLLPLLPVAGSLPSGCRAATGRLRGLKLGPVRLGMSRKRVRGVFARWSTRGRRYMDFFCLNRSGIRVGYASPKLLRALGHRQRRRVRGKALLALTANPHYTLRGVRLRMRVRSLPRRLRIGRPFHIGLNWWYLVPNGASRGVLKVRHGIIEEIGIADRWLTRDRRAARFFLKSFS